MNTESPEDGKPTPETKPATERAGAAAQPKLTLLPEADQSSEAQSASDAASSSEEALTVEATSPPADAAFPVASTPAKPRRKRKPKRAAKSAVVKAAPKTAPKPKKAAPKRKPAPAVRAAKDAPVAPVKEVLKDAVRPLTLAIDIGGTGLKACVLDANGKMITDRVRVPTPSPCPPRRMVETLAKLVAGLPKAERASVGFPGVVRRGKIFTAHNLGQNAWMGFDLDVALTRKLGLPVRVLNDADIQGLGAIKGRGVELVITLGTGVGSSLAEDGRLSTHLELAHHPFRKGETYEEQLGNAALEKVGERRWRKRVLRAIETLRALTHFDHLYFGGGNAKELKAKLPPDVSLVSNELGMKGGIWLWKERTPGSTDIFRRNDR